MPKTEEAILKGELVGKEVEVTRTSNPSLLGLKGTIINETKNMLEIKTKERKQIKLIKNQVTLKFENNIEINGEKIQKRPEERTKSK